MNNIIYVLFVDNPQNKQLIILCNVNNVINILVIYNVYISGYV